ncbi:MAG: 4Fe-4S dicluster domain-containing protein [Thermoleophilia bacterium]|nr:4Fe-4S dicluster domain-containing protein [Thermoleophilia bacterium]
MTNQSGAMSRSDAVVRLLAETRSAAARCYQCGKCSAGCPMVSEMTLPPHDIMRLTAHGRFAEVLSADSLWLCLTCETCSERCPTGTDPAAIIDALREAAVLDGRREVPRSIAAFHRSFLDQVRLTGRLYEAGFFAEYKLRSRALLDDIGNAPGLVRRGKLHPLPHRLHGIGEVRAIFERCGVRASDLSGAGHAPAADDAGGAPGGGDPGGGAEGGHA